MCGIFGAWSRTGPALRPEHVHAATRRLRHRGPDDEGYLFARTRDGTTFAAAGPDTLPDLQLPDLRTASVPEGINLALGFRRLSIIDLSSRGHQPMGNADRSMWIVLNGEIYNYLEMRVELEALGYRFRTATDTEVALAAYETWGPNCLERFNGMWTLAIWDARRTRLFLARDRYGIKPCYVADTDGTLLFASEPKALLAWPGLSPAPNDETILTYLTRGLLPHGREPATFFEKIQSLPPAHYLMVTPDQTRRERYYDLPSPRPFDGTPAAAVDDFRGLLDSAVALHLRSDVAVGTCLSGGLDSSALVDAIARIMAESSSARPGSVGDRQKTFSAVYDVAGPFNELDHIEVMVEHAAVAGHYVRPDAELLAEDFERLVYYQDEPFQSTSIFAQWCVMRLAREHGVTVLLDGQGVDEMLAGYHPFRVYLSDQLRQRGVGFAWREARMLYAGRARAVGAVVEAVARGLPRGPNVFLRKMVGRGVPDRTGVNPDWMAARDDGPLAPPPADLESLLRYQFEDESLPHLLRYEDRNSMANSIESRVPYLDHRLVDFCFSVGAPFRVCQGWTKWILRAAMEHRLPPSIAWRRDKVGFETPETTWLTSLSRGWRERLDDLGPAADYLDAPVVRTALGAPAETMAEARRRWRWINLHAWLTTDRSTTNG